MDQPDSDKTQELEPATILVCTNPIQLALAQGILKVQEIAMRERGWLRGWFKHGRPPRQTVTVVGESIG